MYMQSIDDKELVRQYLDGKEQAFEVLLSRHKDKIYTYVYLMVKDHQLAEDVFQDALIKVINTLKRGKYNEEGKFLPWVMRIAHNLVIDHFRKSNKMPSIGEGTGDDEFNIFSTLKISDPNVEDNMITDQIHGDLRKLLEYLPDEQREVILMRHYADMSFKEIAQQTNVSINTALGRMRYALINLRRIVEEKNIVLTTS
jgi:RNA polymerase sigma factor (sigma-70 family)